MSENEMEKVLKNAIRLIMCVLVALVGWYWADKVEKLPYGEMEPGKMIVIAVTCFFLIKIWRKPTKGKTIEMETENYYRLFWTAVASTMFLWIVNKETLLFSLACWVVPIAHGGFKHFYIIAIRCSDNTVIAMCTITAIQTAAICKLYEGSLLQLIILIVGIIAMWGATSMDYPKKYKNKYLNAFLEWGSEWSLSEAVATCILCSALMMLFIYIQEEFRIESENMERVVRLSKVTVIMLPRAVHKYCFADLMRRHDPIGLKEEIKSLWTQEKREKRAMMFFVGISIFSALAYAYTREEELGKTLFIMGMILCGIATIMAFNEDEEHWWYT